MRKAKQNKERSKGLFNFTLLRGRLLRRSALWLVWLCGVGIFCVSTWSCEPTPPKLDGGNSCHQDDDCDVGSYCKLGICVVVTTEPRQESAERPHEEAPKSDDAGTEPCQSDATRSCQASGVSKECLAGSQRCIGGRWGSCEGTLPRQPETCNGKDDDCDGQIDNHSDQTPLTRSCQTSCGAGTESCIQGAWVSCTAPTRRVEECNGLDDDCDGLIDNQLTAPLCANQRGVCRGAMQRCEGKRGWAPCEARDYLQHHPAYQSQEDQCDGLDNDCDGNVDPTPPCTCQEAEQRPCYDGPPSTAGQGLCRPGQQRCQQGRWSACTGAILPRAELCNQEDDDCDGSIDNDVKRPCRTDCGAGTESCVAGQWQMCSATNPLAEQCNGKDDDCDGKIDNLPNTPNPIQQVCRTTCGVGTEQCIGGQWKNCTAAAPQPELCNGKDDNCDGTIDEALSRRCQGTCQTGTEQCIAGQWQGCIQQKPTFELCNGLDDDCDGKIDNGCFQSLHYKARSGRDFLPAITEDGQYAALLSRDASVSYVRQKDGMTLWQHTSGAVGGIAITQSPFTLASPSTPMVAIFGTELRTQGKLWLYRQQEKQDLWGTYATGTSSAAGELRFIDAAFGWAGVEPVAPAIKRATWSRSSAGVLQLTGSLLSLLNPLNPCEPGRIAYAQPLLLVLCTTYPWQIPQKPTLSEFPSIAQQSTNTSNGGVLLVVPGTLQLRRQFPVVGTPVDLAFTTDQSQQELLISTQSLTKKNGQTTAGHLLIGSWPWLTTVIFRDIQIPAPLGLMARPTGIRTTSDGLALIALQHFDNQSPYTARGGRLAIISLYHLRQGVWLEKQTFPLSVPPAYLDVNDKGTHALLAAPYGTKHELLWLSR